MAQDNRGKNSTQPTRQMWFRTLFSFVILGLFLLAIIGHLFYIQVIQNEYWSTQAVSQQLNDIVVSPHRGTIYDRNGTVLAESMQVWTVIMAPSNIKQEETREKIADNVSKLLDIDRDELYEKTKRSESQYEKIASKLEYPIVEKLTKWIEDNELDNTGIFRIVTDYKRTYPFGSLASTVIGFTGTDYYGLYGLEAEYNETLSGVAGRLVTAQNGVGGDMPVTLTYEKTVDAENGNNLVLSIDSNIQRIAEKYLEESVINNAVTNRGVSIVMNVKTGAILAMAVKGDFNLNDPWNVQDKSVLTTIAKLSGDAKNKALVEARQKQWVNKCVSEFYEPGSVFKIFTSCMALEEGVADTKTTTFYCPGYKEVEDSTIVCWRSWGHGEQHFPDIISNSCNPAFITLGLALGGERFYKYFVGFGFTEPTGIDTLSEAISNPGLYHGIDMSNVDVATSSIGQTFKITPIQMITAISAVANGGYLLEPYLVSEIKDDNGNIISTTNTIKKRQVVSTETTKQVTEMLAAAVNGGGSKNVYVAGYRVAGKSGTADKTETRLDGSNTVWGSFGTFAPADDPVIACLTIIDEPHSSNRYGSHVAGPVCQGILSEALPYLGVEPVYTAEELASLSTTTPNVTGKEVSTANTIIANNDLDVHILGNGKTVLEQVPESGHSIPRGGTVVLFTDEESVGTIVTVPKFIGMTLSQANTTASKYHLNIDVTGIGLESGTATCVRQNWQEGARLEMGSVIQLTFATQDSIA
ncbi:MAG: PASTA domain-containing protein [Clostridia bacterium]|nr:PASTA domain-containing protein [Clostridia bacterium]